MQLIFDNLGIDFSTREATREECVAAVLDAFKGTKLGDACLDTYKNWTGETYVCTLEAGHVAEERNHQGPSSDPQYGLHSWHYRYSHNQTPTSAMRHESIIDAVCVEVAVRHGRHQFASACTCGENLLPEGYVVNASLTGNEYTFEAFMLAHVAKKAAAMAFDRALA